VSRARTGPVALPRDRAASQHLWPALSNIRCALGLSGTPRRRMYGLSLHAARSSEGWKVVLDLSHMVLGPPRTPFHSCPYICSVRMDVS
jgi:hypothetical protein